MKCQGGEDNYLDGNSINAIRHLTSVFLGHTHRVELVVKFGTGKFFLRSSPTHTLRDSVLYVLCSTDMDPFLGQCDLVP